MPGVKPGPKPKPRKRRTREKYKLRRRTWRVLSVENMQTAILYYAGNMTCIAEAFRMSRQGVYQFIDRHPELKKDLAEGRRILVDESKQGLRNAILREEGWAIALCLTTLGKDEGFVRGLVMGGGVDPATGQMSPVVLTMPDNGRNPNLSPERLADLPAAETTTEGDDDGSDAGTTTLHGSGVGKTADGGIAE